MSNWLISLEGTPSGHTLALALALLAAFLHAVFGALQKGRFDPWLTRGAIDITYGLIAAPFALFVVPWPLICSVHADGLEFRDRRFDVAFRRRPVENFMVR